MTRFAALLLAFFCLWISGGVTLNHSDDLTPFLTFHAGGSHLSHAVSATGPDACPACQWENAAFDPQVPLVHAPRLPLFLMPLPAPGTPSHPQTPFNHTSPRGPPHTA